MYRKSRLIFFTLYQKILIDYYYNTQVKIPKMESKLPYSQITMPSNQKLAKSQFIFNYNYPNNGRTGLNHSKTEIMPFKFSRKRQLKTTMRSSYQQTMQNPQKCSIRTFQGSANSQLFQPKSTLKKTSYNINHYPQALFHSDNYKKLLAAGSCSILKFQSEQYPKKYHVHQQIKNKNYSSTMYRPDPIIIGEMPVKQNSTLQTIWKDERRHRDNGAKCSQILQWNPQIKKRQLYKIKSHNNLY